MNAKEIAKIAGVSRSTVTGVVNDYSFISAKTKKKVRAIIEEYGYVPNSSARGLVGKKSKIIGLFIYNEDNIATSQYYSTLIVNVIDHVQTLGYSVMVHIINDNNDRHILKFLQNESIQGAIISGGTFKENDIKNLLNFNFKLVFIDKLVYGRELKENISIVNRNNFKGGYMATEYLIKMGHRDIIHITGQIFRFSSVERTEGYKKALEDNGIKVENKKILLGDFSDESAEKLILGYLKKNKKPSALFAANDMSAIGAIRAFKSFGLKIPEDVSVVGFDDIFVSKEIEPKLTTVKANTKMVAFESAEKLIKMIENDEIGSSKTLIELSLVERESVKRII